MASDFTEKLLNRIYSIKNVNHITVSGEDLPAVLNAGPGKGQPVNHPERHIVTIKGEEVELRLLVGRVFVEINDIDNVPKAVEDIEEVCKELLPFGFNLEVGRYSKFRPTVTDYKKNR